MIINSHKFEKFEHKLISKKRNNIKENFKIVNALYKEAAALGIMPLKNPLDGLDIDIKISQVVNKCSKNYLQK